MLQDSVNILDTDVENIPEDIKNSLAEHDVHVKYIQGRLGLHEADLTIATINNDIIQVLYSESGLGNNESRHFLEITINNINKLKLHKIDKKIGEIISDHYVNYLNNK